ncbi:MAG TPA: ABC transporter permease [Methanoregulaceae archaeon]|jgi:putative ABC transport system permease protein|nr:ABC transporter permease [Methanoregulaceae archaeon]
MLAGIRVSLFLALRALRRGNLGSLLLTVVIVGMVFTNMIFMPSIITGAIKNYEQQTIETYTSDIIIQPKEDAVFIDDLQALLDKVNRVPGVWRASPHYAAGASLQYRGNVLPMAVIGVIPRDERLVTTVHSHMIAGNYLGDGDTGEIVIGKYVAGERDVSDVFLPSLGGVRVGDTISAAYTNGVVREYRVKGIFQTYSFNTDAMAFTTWEEMELVAGESLDQASVVLVKTSPGYDEAAVKKTLLRYGVQEKVQTWLEFLGTAYTDAVESYAILNSITTVVSLVIAAVVLFVVIMIKTLNSRRQIGILLAIGIRRDIIINSYLFQVLILASLGIVFGILVVLGLTAYFTAYPIEFPEGSVSPYLVPAEIGTNALYLFFTSALAGFIPAWRIARKDILESMRA